MWEAFQIWIKENEFVIAWALGISALTFVGSLIAVPIVVIQMRTDFFVRGAKAAVPLTPLRLARHMAKNVLGAILLLMGFGMLFLPGQGLLTLLLGLSLLDFPGKRGLQLKLVRLKGVRRSIDWMRHRAGKEPLEIPRGSR